MAERKLPKLETGVRFPSPALFRSVQRRRVTRYRGAVGHRSFSGHWAHRGTRRLADLTAEPDERHVQRGAQPVRHQLVQDAVGAFGRGLRRASIPSRRVTRWTCVSTGIASRPSAKLSTTAAVFGPMPGQRRQVVARLGVGHLAQASSGRTRPRARRPRAGSPGSAAPWCWRARRCGSRRRRRRSARRRPLATVGYAARSARTPARR